MAHPVKNACQAPQDCMKQQVKTSFLGEIYSYLKNVVMKINLNFKSLYRVKSVIYHQWKILPLKRVIFIVTFLYLTLALLHNNSTEYDNEEFEVNNFGPNHNLLVNKTRYRDVPKSKLKNILFWNDAYEVRTYDVGFGQEHFYENLCPDTRCYTTSNRSYLKSVDDFDAVVIHQRGIDWKDMPKKRKPHQR